MAAFFSDMNDKTICKQGLIELDIWKCSLVTNFNQLRHFFFFSWLFFIVHFHNKTIHRDIEDHFYLIYISNPNPRKDIDIHGDKFDYRSLNDTELLVHLPSHYVSHAYPFYITFPCSS